MWQCPDCDRSFTRHRHPHSCVRASVDDFLRKKPPILVELYRRFEKMALAIGNVDLAPAKTRVGFQHGRIFAAANGLSRNGLRIHIVTKAPIKNPRVARLETMAADCYVNHFVLRSETEIDAELRKWLRKGYEWA